MALKRAPCGTRTLLLCKYKNLLSKVDKDDCQECTIVENFEWFLISRFLKLKIKL